MTTVAAIVLLPEVVKGSRRECIFIYLLDPQMVLVRSEALLLLGPALLLDAGQTRQPANGG